MNTTSLDFHPQIRPELRERYAFIYDTMLDVEARGASFDLHNFYELLDDDRIDLVINLLPLIPQEAITTELMIECGTTCCISGWVALTDRWKEDGGYVKVTNDGNMEVRAKPHEGSPPSASAYNGCNATMSWLCNAPWHYAPARHEYNQVEESFLWNFYHLIGNEHERISNETDLPAALNLMWDIAHNPLKIEVEED